MAEDGHWVTLAGEHVFIGSSGTIEKGPAHLVGKPAGVHAIGASDHANVGGESPYDAEFDHGEKGKGEAKRYAKEIAGKIREKGLHEKFTAAPHETQTAIMKSSGAYEKAPEKLAERFDSQEKFHSFMAKAVHHELSHDSGKMKMDNDGEADALLLGNIPLGDFTEALTLGSDFPHPKERNGLKCHYRWKESLPIGKTFHDAKGRQWHFSAAEAEQTLSTLKAARSLGYEPSIPSSHKVNEGKNYGYIVDARRNSKGNIELLHQFLGDGALGEALTRKTSICIRPEVKLSDGKVYRYLVDHNAAIVNPQLTDLEDFKPALAASGQAARAVVLELAAPSTQESTMDLSKIKKLVGAAENATDEQVLAAAETKLGEMSASVASVKTLTEEKAQLSRDLAAAKLELSRAGGEPAKPTARDLQYAGKIARQSRESAIKSGGITPANADKIEKALLPKTVAADALTLSRAVEDDDDRLLLGLDTAAAVFDALVGNQPTPVANKLELGRHPIDSGDPDADKAAEEEGRKQGEAHRKRELANRGIKE